MAYNFTAASSQSLSVGSTPVTAPAFTLACWFRRSTFSGTPAIVAISQFQDAAGHGHVLTLRTDSQLGAGSFDGTYHQCLSGATVSQDVWTHGAGVWASTTSRTVYLNGVAGTTNINSRNPTNLSRIGIGALIRPTPVDLFNGQIAPTPTGTPSSNWSKNCQSRSPSSLRRFLEHPEPE